jgi:ferredoxin-NADP reductase
MSHLNVKVAAIEQVTEHVKHFILVSENGEKLPAFSGGSHVVLALNINGRIHRNPYSLMSSPLHTESYGVSVRKQEMSRGGSVYMHEKIEVGSHFQITYPVNLFSLSKLSHKNILIAGGIGITPFLSQIVDLNRIQTDYELHYAYRAPEHAAFREEIEEMCGNRSHFYVASDGETMDFHALLSKQPLGTHVYVCGPEPMVNAMIDAARELGWPEKHIHNEQFTAPQIGEAFKVKLALSNIELEVPSEMSMLEAIEEAGVDAPFLCRGGACGRCELEVIACDGSIIHHDNYLTDAEKNSGKKIMPCVSRAKCQNIVVNL